MLQIVIIPLTYAKSVGKANITNTLKLCQSYHVPNVVYPQTHPYINKIKGEHWCKTMIKGVQDWGKT